MKNFLFLLLGVLFFGHAHAQTFSIPNYFLGAPYMENPLGEGDTAPYTPHPLSRQDAFDCTTYVETILAQHKAQVQGGLWQEYLKKLRYMGNEIDFFSRTHVMEYQWIPNAIHKKFITPLALKNTQQSKIQINLQNWFLKHQAAHNKDAAYEKKARLQPNFVQASIAYVPTSAITPAFLRTLPQSTVVFFLKKLSDDLGYGRHKGQVLVTHMGILQGQYLYHASMKFKQVQKIALLDYLQAHPYFVGVSFYKII